MPAMSMSSKEQEKELALLLYQGKPQWKKRARSLLRHIRYPQRLELTALDMLDTGRGSSDGRTNLLSFIKQ